MPEDTTFQAFEKLKEDANGLDVLIEVAPPGVSAALEWVFEIDYAERKRELLAERESVRRTYEEHRRRIEQTYGSSVLRALERREDGEQPRFDPERLRAELEDAANAVDELYDAIDTAFLTRPERGQLATLENDIKTARGYVQNKEHFDRKRTEIQAQIERFDARFAPYEGAPKYMITTDHEALMAQANEIWRELSDTARELVLPALPDDDADWLAAQKTRFGELVDSLPHYNTTFVKQERERYTDLFVTEHGPLNDQQQTAIVRDDRRNLVDASAGTGKTLTLTYRFIYLLEKGVSVNDIAAITYTSDAADEMKERIAAATNISPERLNVSTIHSFAYRIYREAQSGGETNLGAERERLVKTYYWAARNEDANIPNEIAFPELFEIFQEALNEFMTIEGAHGEEGYIADNSRNEESRWEFVQRKLDEFVDKSRTFDRSADEIRAELDGTNELRETFGTAGSALVEAYEQIIEDEDAPTDFDDMIYTATSVVQSNPELFGARFTHLLVDEFQDVSDATLSFIESFMKGDSETHLFCVGDDWQSIFGFTGSNVRYFTEYEERFDDVTYTELQVNYRCPPAIVDAGSDLMAQSAAPQNEKSVRADSDLETDPMLHTTDLLYDERVVPYVADMVESKLAEGRDFEDIMVLSRNDEKSQYMEELRQELERRQIPHRRPKYMDDYLPPDYEPPLEYDVTLDEKGFVEYNVPEDVAQPDDAPPIVKTQSVHASKGTEAPVVILLHAVDDDRDGIPSEERLDEILEPAMNVTAEHIPEERRLFYVALTRTEDEFHAVARPGAVSRYIQDISEYFTAAPVPDVFVGKCTAINYPRSERRPIKGTLDCGDFEIPLLSWHDQDPPLIEAGKYYRLRLTDPSSQIDRDEFGEEVRFDRTPIELIGASPAADDD